MSRSSDRKPSPGYQLFMMALCVFSLAVLAFQASRPTNPATVVILEYADFVACLIFMTDFLKSLFEAENKWHYFRTWGWLDLLSSIPTVDIARWGRAARVFRIVRVLRGLRATKIVAGLVQKKRAENVMLAAALVAFMVVTFCSVAILHFESGPDANIQSADDAVWWAFATITTVGYGDRYPTTDEGRLVAVILMSVGVGLFGTFSGFLASWFVGEDEETVQSEIAALRQEIAKLRQDLSREGIRD